MIRWLAILLCSAPVLADVRLASVFGDYMVLQRDRKIAVWGWADPGEAVTVTFRDQTAKTVADADARWSVVLGPFEAVSAQVLRVEGNNVLELEHVCVGDVWICSGQSNMQWPVRNSMNGADEVEAANEYQLRLFTVPGRVADEPREDVRGKWDVARPKSVANFSAVAYYFGLELRKAHGVPIGLVQAALGGTPAEAWMRREAIAGHPSTQPILARWDEVLAQHPERQKEFRRELDAWKQAAADARKANQPLPRRPRPPVGPNHPHRPGGLFHGMVAPLLPLRTRGVIWYQGESNASRAAQYHALFPALIRDWRAAFRDPDLPFLFVQLANFRPLRRDPGPSAWAELREAQRLALAEPRTAMAVAIDIGDATDIHPRNKQEVGRRLALAAGRLVYGDAGTVSSGPLFEGHTIADSKVVVRFRHVGGGLATQNDDPLRGFAIAGADRRYRWAHARIEGDTVVVWHPQVKEPAGVRYGWADNPICNLINAAGLPASPFRTDAWPLSTAAAK